MDNTFSPNSKIALFRSLFRGREDVYPLRFESRKTGKCGYQPACANEWVKGLCNKGLVKCAVCPNRRFLPITDKVIRWHLSGCDDRGRDFVMGLYPMFLDETCFLLAVDFDKERWREDTSAFITTCCKLDIPAASETIIHDERFGGIPLNVTFQGELRPAQIAAARAMDAHDTGV